MAFKKSEELTDEELEQLGEKPEKNKHKHKQHEEKCNCEKNDCECDEKCECEHISAQENLQEAMNYLEMAQRIQAEFDNYRKRTISAEKDARKNGICEAVEKFLPVIDSLDNAKRQVSDENFKKALDLVQNQVMQSLKSLGVEKIPALDQPFDPNLHNAIMAGSDSEKPDEIILEEFQAGFKLDGKVIRHSVVKVNKL